MHLKQLMMMAMMMMWGLVGMAAAEYHCDPITQYELNGQCCDKCGPGTSMSSLGSCQEPQCKECRDDEYQDNYTDQPKCELQKYCDPNKNFQTPVHDKKKQSTCLCKVGFHCSATECITCVPHKVCPPGQGAQPKGDQTRDTVCQKCPNGTYSNETSWDSVCVKWTECGNGQYVEKSGTDTSDNICADSSRTHLMIGLVVLAVVVVLLSVVMFLLCRGNRGGAKGKVKDCIESCLGEEREPLKEAGILITNPTEPADEESMLPEMQSSQEESSPRTPEENEEKNIHLTDNGNIVTEDNGKSEQLSRQESQTQAFTD